MKNNIFKILTLLFVIIYVVSPVDAAPGPIDDALVSIIWIILNRKPLVGQ